MLPLQPVAASRIKLAVSQRKLSDRILQDILLQMYEISNNMLHNNLASALEWIV